MKDIHEVIKELNNNQQPSEGILAYASEELIEEISDQPIKNQTTLSDVVNILTNAERLGANKDKPEGARYIQLSETLVNELIYAIINSKTTS